MSSLRSQKTETANLLLDPNNYRFQETDGFVYADEGRFHEPTVQQKAFDRIKKEEGLLPLKNSILRNGYVPVESIVVRPYGAQPGKFVVVEGNRRTAAVKWILEDHAAGLPVSETVLESIKFMPTLIAEEAGRDEVFRASLMGIRHVSGIKEWGGYQRAKLVTEMRDVLHLPAGEVAERLAMKAQEVNRRYRAFRALEQMQNDEEFSEHAMPALYPIFHEAVSLPIIREWLGWDDEKMVFKNDETRRQFYELICPSTDDDGGEKAAKITSYSQVRDLRPIFEKPDARRILLDPSRSFQDAYAVAQNEKLSRMWATEVSEAIRALNGISIQDLKGITAEDLAVLTELAKVVAERLKDYRTLNPSS